MDVADLYANAAENQISSCYFVNYMVGKDK